MAEGLEGLQDSDILYDYEPKAESIYTICYTSGSTGKPKGTLISNRAIMANASTIELFDANFQVSSDDIYISYLPLAHVLERLMIVGCYGYAIAIGFYHGNVTKLTEDMQVLKPTILVSVPRLMNRLHDLLKRRIASL